MTRTNALEIKSVADDGDVSGALETLTKSVNDALAGIERTMGKIVDDAVAPLKDDLTDIMRKQNRPRNPGDPSAEDHEGLAVASLEAKAVRSFLQSGVRNFVPSQHLTGDEMKSMSVGSDPDGGYTVFPVLSAGVTKKIFDQSPMRRLSDVVTITAGDAWEEPVDLDDLGAVWVGETQSRTETSTPQVGVLTVPVHEIYAMPKVSQRMLDDSSWKIGQWLESKISDKFGRSEGYAALLGSGVAQPRGLLTYDTDPANDASRPWGTVQHIPSVGVATIEADGLKSVVWALRAPYRLGASWLMNSNTAGSIDKLKNVTGDYIWRDGMTSGAQPSLLGYPVEIDENMPDIAAGSYPVAFGNFKKAYVIVDKAGYKLLQDPYTEKPYVLLYAYRRTGGGLRNSEAVKFLKIAAI